MKRRISTKVFTDVEKTHPRLREKSTNWRARNRGRLALSKVVFNGRMLTLRFFKESCTMPKRTFQPNNRRRAKIHGFRARMKTRGGQLVLKSRRDKGRKRVVVEHY